MTRFRFTEIEMLALVTATKNSAETLPSTLKSLSAVGDLVLSIFIDGRSSDSTMDILAEYIQENDSAILLSQRGSGLYDAINQGIEVALKHPGVTHIGLLHSDDVLVLPDYRDYVESIYRSDAEVHYSDIRFHDTNGRVVRFWKAGKFTSFRLRTGWMPPHTSMIVKNRVFGNAGLFRLDFGTSADYEWIVRVLQKREHAVAYFPRTTVSMQTGGASDSGLSGRLRANHMDGRVWSGESVLHSWIIRVLKPLRKIGQFWSVKGRI